MLASTLVSSEAFECQKVGNWYDLGIRPWLISIPFKSGRGTCVYFFVELNLPMLQLVCLRNIFFFFSFV